MEKAHKAAQHPLPKMSKWKSSFMRRANIKVKSSLVFAHLEKYTIRNNKKYEDKDKNHTKTKKMWLAELQAQSGGKFDRFLVDSCLGRIENMERKLKGLPPKPSPRLRVDLPKVRNAKLEFLNAEDEARQEFIRKLALANLHIPEEYKDKTKDQEDNVEKTPPFKGGKRTPPFKTPRADLKNFKSTGTLTSRSLGALESVFENQRPHSGSSSRSTTVTYTNQLLAVARAKTCLSAGSPSQRGFMPGTKNSPRHEFQVLKRRSSFANMVAIVKQRMALAAEKANEKADPAQNKTDPAQNKTVRRALTKLLGMPKRRKKVSDKPKVAPIATRPDTYVNMCKELRIDPVQRYIESKLILFLREMSTDDAKSRIDYITGVPQGLLPMLMIRLHLPNSDLSGAQMQALMMTEVRQLSLHVDRCKMLGWRPWHTEEMDEKKKEEKAKDAQTKDEGKTDEQNEDAGKKDAPVPETEEERPCIKESGIVIESVDASNNCLSDLSCKFMIEVTKFTLMDLDLSHNKITLSSVKAIANTLKAPSCHLVNLCVAYTGLKDRAVQCLCLGLRDNGSLQRLSLEGNHVADPGGEHLHQALCYRNRVKQVGHHHGQHGNRRRGPERNLADYHHPCDLTGPARRCLVSLCVGHNDMTNRGAKLVEIPAIESLDLCFNPMGNDPNSALIVAAAITTNTTLKHLNVDFCKFSHRDLKIIGKSLHENQTLLGIHTLSFNTTGFTQDSQGYMISTGPAEHPVKEKPMDAEINPIRIRAHHVLNKSRSQMLKSTVKDTDDNASAASAATSPGAEPEHDPENPAVEAGKWVDAQSWAVHDETSYARKRHHTQNRHKDCWVCGGWREMWLVLVRRRREAIETFGRLYREHHRHDEEYTDQARTAAMKGFKKNVAIFPVHRVLIHLQSNGFKPQPMMLCPPPEDSDEEESSEASNNVGLAASSLLSSIGRRRRLSESSDPAQQMTQSLKKEKETPAPKSNEENYPRSAICQVLPPGRTHFYFTVEHERKDGTIVHEYNICSKYYQKEDYEIDKFKTRGPEMPMNFVDVEPLRGCPFMLVSTVPRYNVEKHWASGGYRLSGYSVKHGLFRKHAPPARRVRKDMKSKAFLRLWVAGEMNKVIEDAEKDAIRAMRPPDMDEPDEEQNSFKKAVGGAMEFEYSSSNDFTAPTRARSTFENIRRSKALQKTAYQNLEAIMDLFNHISFRQHDWELDAEPAVGTGEIGFQLSVSSLWDFLVSSGGAAFNDENNLSEHDIDIILYRVCGLYQPGVDYSDLGPKVKIVKPEKKEFDPFPIQRRHFLPILVHVAARIFPHQYAGAFCSPRRAFEMLLEHFVLPSHTPEMHARSFREDFFFTEQVDHFFRHHLHTVRRLFSIFADTSIEIASQAKPCMPRVTNIRHPILATKPQVVGVEKRLTWRRWVTLCERARLVSDRNLKVEQARTAFFNSKVLKYEFALQAKAKSLQTLDILEFMQAIARLAQMVIPVSTQSDECSQRAAEICRADPHPSPNALFREDGLCCTETVWALVRQLGTLFVDHLIPLCRNIEN